MKSKTLIIMIFIVTVILSSCNTPAPQNTSPADVDISTPSPDELLLSQTPETPPADTPTLLPTPNVPVPEGIEVYIPQNPCDSPYEPIRSGSTWTESITTKDNSFIKVTKITQVSCDLTSSNVTYEYRTDESSYQVNTIKQDFVSGEITEIAQSITANKDESNNVTETSTITSCSHTRKADLPNGFSIGEELTNTDVMTCLDEVSTEPMVWEISEHIQIVGFETITVPAGTFTALHKIVTTDNKFKPEGFISEIWTVYGIGVVKFASENGTTRELIDYSIPE